MSASGQFFMSADTRPHIIRHRHRRQLHHRGRGGRRHPNGDHNPRHQRREQHRRERERPKLSTHNGAHDEAHDSRRETRQRQLKPIHPHQNARPRRLHPRSLTPRRPTMTPEHNHPRPTPPHNRPRQTTMRHLRTPHRLRPTPHRVFGRKARLSRATYSGLSRSKRYAPRGYFSGPPPTHTATAPREHSPRAARHSVRWDCYFRLTVTPLENIESCNSIASGTAPGGTSKDATDSTDRPGLMSSLSPGAPRIALASYLLPPTISF